MKKWIGVMVGMLMAGYSATALAATDVGYIRPSEPAQAYHVESCAPQERAGRYDVFGEAGYSWSARTYASGSTASNYEFLDFRRGWAGGGGVGYNICDYFNFNVDVNASELKVKRTTKVSAGTVKETTIGDNTLVQPMVNFEYYPLKYAITPVIGVGAGGIYSRGYLGGIKRGEIQFAYGAAAGFRWDISKHVFVKGLYRVTWSQYQDTENAALFRGAFLYVGLTF